MSIFEKQPQRDYSQKGELVSWMSLELVDSQPALIVEMIYFMYTPEPAVSKAKPIDLFNSTFIICLSL